MKIVNIILSVVALGLIIFNATKLNFDSPFAGESMVAVIVIMASLCAIILLQILMVSKRIEKISKQKR